MKFELLQSAMRNVTEMFDVNSEPNSSTSGIIFEVYHLLNSHLQSAVNRQPSYRAGDWWVGVHAQACIAVHDTAEAAAFI